LCYITQGTFSLILEEKDSQWLCKNQTKKEHNQKSGPWEVLNASCLDVDTLGGNASKVGDSEQIKMCSNRGERVCPMKIPIEEPSRVMWHPAIH
jgi:hypothetical protein